MSGYTKLFSSILLSTVWEEPDPVRIVWITMLAIKDGDGMIAGSVPGLARLARVSLDDTEAALKRLSDPDPHSRTPEFEGRRIAKVDGGWIVLNHDKYKHMLDKDELREKAAERKRRSRERKGERERAAVTLRHTKSRGVPPASPYRSDPDHGSVSSSDQGSLFPSSPDPSVKVGGDQDRGAVWRPVVERFHALYFAAYGTKPTWGARQVGMLKKLVASHSASEAIRRMEILFASPPSWLTPPFDVGTLVQHFDKLAAVAVEPRDPRRGLTPDEIIAVGEEMDREMGIDHDPR